MKELQLKPRVTGNMDKIPYYVNVKHNLNDRVQLISREDIYVDIDGERKYFNEVLKTPEGIYLPIKKLAEICSGTINLLGKDLYIDNLKFENSIYRLILRNFNETSKIINRNNKGDVYTITEKDSQSSDTINNDTENTIYEDSINYINYESEGYI